MDTQLDGPALNDGILGPGDSVNVTPIWRVGAGGFSGGNGTIAASPNANTGTPTYLQPLAGKPTGDFVFPANPFVVQLGADYQCGLNAPVTASVAGADGNGTYPLSIPTGVAGPHTNYVSDDVGDPVDDAGTVSSQVDVTADGKVKSVRVHIDSITHTYSLRWYDITLVSPAGTRVRIWNRTGDSAQKAITNVTFSDAATEAATSTGITQYSNLTLRPDESLSAFNGEDAKGSNPWTLLVRDTNEINNARSGTRSSRTGTGRAGGGSEIVGEVNGWSLDIANAECGRVPVPQIAPQPLVLNPSPATAQEQTVIDGSGSVDPGKNNAGTANGAITKYEWKIGTAGWVVGPADGKFPYTGGPQAKIKVGLRVTDSDNQTATKEIDALVTRRPVVNTATSSPVSPEANQLVTLNAGATDPDGTIAQYQWDFDGDGIFEVTSTDGPSTIHTWTTSGPQVVRVKVTDNIGATAVKSFIVTVSNKPPVAKIKANVSPAVLGQPVTFDASESTDTDGTIATYDWDLDGQAGYEVAGTTKPTYVKTFDETGTKTVNVRVTDNSGQSATATMTILVTAPPKGVIQASTNTPKPKDMVTFDGRASTDSEIGGTIARYEWDTDGNGSIDKEGPVVSVAYPNVANVQVRLRVTGSTGAKADATTMVSVTNPIVPTVVPPAATPTPKPTLPPGGFVPTPVGEIPVVVGKDVDTKIFPPSPVTPNEVSSPREAINPPSDDSEPSDNGVLETGFQVKLGVAAKQKGKKAIKGIAMSVKVNGPSVIVVKGYFDAKTAKKLKLKPKKNAPLAVASGRLVMKKSGSYKFVVKVPKKYQRFVKKADKSKLMFRAAVTETASKKTLAIGKNIVLVK